MLAGVLVFFADLLFVFVLIFPFRPWFSVCSILRRTNSRPKDKLFKKKFGDEAAHDRWLRTRCAQIGGVNKFSLTPLPAKLRITYLHRYVSVGSRALPVHRPIWPRRKMNFAARLVCLLACGLSLHAPALTNLNVRLVSNARPSANPLNYGDVWAENDIACLGVWLNYSAYNYGVGIYSISNPASPVLLSVYSPSPSSQNQFELGAVRNRIGYFGSWSGGGLHIVSLTNPALPVLLCRVGATTGNVTNGFDRVHTTWLERNYLYEAAHVPGIVSVKVFDVSNPALPVYLRDIVTTNTTKVHQITVRNKGTDRKSTRL